jgi:ferrous iron transport protein B
MARAAFLMDKIMGGAGLHGRAFIPLLSSFACAIPGIMATRVIDAKRDRLATILVAPLMTCSARIPVYTLIIAAFIPQRQVWGFLINLQGLVMFGLYAAGIVSALLVSFVIRKIFWRGTVEPFIMELPTFKAPDAKNVALNVYQRGEIFMKRAGGIILTAQRHRLAAVDLPLSPRPNATGPAIDYSFAGIIGHFARADLRAHRLQLADGRRPDPRHGGPRGRRGGAGHGLFGVGRGRGHSSSGPLCWPTSGPWPPPCPSWPGTSSPRSARRPWRW